VDSSSSSEFEELSGDSSYVAESVVHAGWSFRAVNHPTAYSWQACKECTAVAPISVGDRR
jgi:hypothetical protein